MSEKPKIVCLCAYHGDPAIKAKYLTRVEAHRVADEIAQGYGYWRNGKGCSVGCTIHGDKHKDYEIELGIPEPIAHLEDVIFEGLPGTLAKAWPSRFLAAIDSGVDLSQVADRFCFWLLTSSEIRLDELAEPDGKLAIAWVANLYRRRLDRDEPTATEWIAAGGAAADASSVASKPSADQAAWAASSAATTTATAARATATATAGAATSAAAGIDAWAAARADAWVMMATRLEKLLNKAPIATTDLTNKTKVK